MKKMIIPILTIGSLFLFSFTSSEKLVCFKETSLKDGFKNAKELGSFVEFEQTRYTSDKTEWNHRRQTWTDFAKITNLKSLEKTINNN